MIGTFSGMGGAKKNVTLICTIRVYKCEWFPEWDAHNRAFFPKTPIIQYFLTANPSPQPPSHTQHTISKICSDINKKGGFSNGMAKKTDYCSS